MTNSELVTLVFIVTCIALALIYLGDLAVQWWRKPPADDFVDESCGSGGYSTEECEADQRARRAGL
jgi:hypothetical protein